MSLCGFPLEILIAKKAGFISSGGVITLRSPPNKTPDFSTTEAIEISSAVSPEPGTITSPPLL